MFYPHPFTKFEVLIPLPPSPCKICGGGGGGGGGGSNYEISIDISVNLVLCGSRQQCSGFRQRILFIRCTKPIILFPLLFYIYSTYNNIWYDKRATGKNLKEIEIEQNKRRWFTANPSTRRRKQAHLGWIYKNCTSVSRWGTDNHT